MTWAMPAPIWPAPTTPTSRGRKAIALGAAAVAADAEGLVGTTSAASEKFGCVGRSQCRNMLAMHKTTLSTILQRLRSPASLSKTRVGNTLPWGFQWFQQDTLVLR